MASVKIITRAHGTVVRNIVLAEGVATAAVDQVADTLDSIIAEDKDVLQVVVDYDGCNDSKTIEGDI
jgi:hypothetical protein